MKECFCRKIISLVFVVFISFIFLLLPFTISTPSFAQTTDLIVDGYELVGKERVSRTDYEYTYWANIINNGTTDYINVSAILTSSSSTTTIIDDSLTFGAVDGGTSIASEDTFTVRIDRRHPFNESDLSWETIAETEPLLFKLPDTGQATSYTTTFGEDSDYTLNPPSYTDNMDGTVTDNVTGLMWQQEDDNIQRNWVKAGVFCDTLNLAEKSDWRLPNIVELQSIVDYGRYYPAINSTYFLGTDTSNFNSHYWTSITSAYSSDRAWFLGFRFGAVRTSNFATDRSYVRCVRGEELVAAKNFTNNNNVTVLDNDTGLIWQRREGGARSWESALTYCENLSLAEKSDWRLPNIKELTSLVDYSVFNSTLNRWVFQKNNSFFWSSTTRADGVFARRVYFYNGGVGLGGKSTNHYVRCVRGGQ